MKMGSASRSHCDGILTGVISYRDCDIVIIIIGSTALDGPWPPPANVASDLYPRHQPANFNKPVSLRLPPPRQSILNSVGQVIVDLHGLSTDIFLGNSLSSIRTTWPAHLSLTDFITLTVFGSL